MRKILNGKESMKKKQKTKKKKTNMRNILN